MNNKRTNYLIAILNIIVVITKILLIIFLRNVGMAVGTTDGNETMQIESLYGCRALEILAGNIELIHRSVCGILTIANIVSAIQNRKNKKIFFWQLTFGILILYMGIYDLLGYDLYEWSIRIIVGVIPIIFAIINIIKTRRNKPIRLQFISYIIAIVIAIVGLIFPEIIMIYVWSIILIIMQFIYIRKQEKNIDEGNVKKIVNIILYYIIETLIVILFFGLSTISMVNTKINDHMFRKEVSDLYKKICGMQGIENDEIYIPVEKSSKYGYVDENYKEKITTEYDRATFFINREIDGKKCHFALVEKDGNNYIISKSNDKIEISNNKYLKLFKKVFGKIFDESSEKYKDYTTNNTYFAKAYLTGNVISDIYYSVSEERYDWNEVDNLEEEKEIEIKLEEINHKYYYKTENYTIEIEQLEEAHYYETKARIKVTKKDGTISSNIEKITIDDDKRIKTLSNGCIAFENEEGHTNGWYDKYGNRIQIGGNYELLDIKYNKIFIYDYENYIYYILNMNGKTILKTEALDIFNYNDKILMKNKNNKMVICDGELNEISNEYDKIIISSWIDMTPEFSSYGKRETDIY